MRRFISAALAAITALTTNEEAWSLLIRDGDRAMIVAVARSSDPDGASFRKQVARVRQKMSGEFALGLIRRLPTGGLAFITSDRPERALRLHAMLCQTAQDVEIPNLVVIQMRGADIVHTELGVNLSAQARFLAQLDAGGQGVFGLLTGDELKAPRLLIAADDADLTAQMSAEKSRLQRKGRVIRGRLRRTAKGQIELRIRKDRPETLGDVAAWAAANADRWPALRDLTGARLTITDAEGTVVSRHRAA